MSIRELRLRINEFSCEINLQKELLKKLEKDESLVQHQLNAVMDPVARLPLEISSQIFLHILDPSPVPKPGVCHALMVLLNVCDGWTTIALSTPDLWTAIHIVFPLTNDIARVLPLWFGRHNCSVSLFLHGN
jgi:hypothetical protein